MKITPKELRALADAIAPTTQQTEMTPRASFAWRVTTVRALRRAADDLESYQGMLNAALKIGELNADAAARWRDRFERRGG